MSLEQAITDHASALRELAAAIRGTISQAHGITAATDQVIGAAKTAAAATTSVTKEVTEAKKPDVANPAAAGSKSEAGPASSDAALTYDAVKDKILTLSKEKGREPTVALLQRHGVAKAPDLKPAQYAAVIADVDALLAGTYDPVTGEPA